MSSIPVAALFGVLKMSLLYMIVLLAGAFSVIVHRLGVGRTIICGSLLFTAGDFCLALASGPLALTLGATASSSYSAFISRRAWQCGLVRFTLWIQRQGSYG